MEKKESIKSYFSIKPRPSNNETESTDLEKDTNETNNKRDNSCLKEDKKCKRKDTRTVTVTIRDAWFTEFEWLQRHISLPNKLFCKVCKDARSSTIWDEGKLILKKEQLVRHTASISHQTSISRIKSRKSFKVSVNNAISKSDQSIIRKMKTVYFLAKNSIATSKCANFHKHCDEILKDEKDSVVLSDSYSNDTHAWFMIELFSEIIEQNLISKIKASKYYSICADESTDISITKNLIIYCRYLDQEDCKVKTEFLKLLKVED